MLSVFNIIVLVLLLRLTFGFYTIIKFRVSILYKHIQYRKRRVVGHLDLNKKLFSFGFNFFMWLPDTRPNEWILIFFVVALLAMAWGAYVILLFDKFVLRIGV